MSRSPNSSLPERSPARPSTSTTRSRRAATTSFAPYPTCSSPRTSATTLTRPAPTCSASPSTPCWPTRAAIASTSSTRCELGVARSVQLRRRPQAEEAARIALVDLGLVLVAGPHPLHGRDGVPDEPGPFLGVEREVGAEQDMVGPEEGQARFHGVPGAEKRRVAVEHPEVVDWPPAQPGEGAGILRIVTPAAELVQAAADAACAERNHRAQVVGDDHEVRIPVEDPREHEPAHGDTGLVRPPERPPEVALRPRLSRIVGDGSRPGRVHPDRQTMLGHAPEDGPVFRAVERPAVDVG